MSFKIEAKANYTLITPQFGSLNAQAAADLADVCQKNASSGNGQFIIDLKDSNSVSDDFAEPMIELAAAHYERDKSFVLANVPQALTALLKQMDAIDLLNCAPTYAEAVDIISMEQLERDLYNEEAPEE